MSTGKAHISNNQEISLATLLAQQEAERAARLRRMNDANKKIENAHFKYSQLEQRLQRAKGQFPVDFVYTTPELILPKTMDDDPVALERYADALQAQIHSIERGIESAEREAKAAHDNRIAVERAWHMLHANRTSFCLILDSVASFAKLLGESYSLSFPSLPASDSDLHRLQISLQQEQSLLKNASELADTLQIRHQSRSGSHKSTGEKIEYISGHQVLSNFHEEELMRERLAAQQIIENCLKKLSLKKSDLPTIVVKQLGGVVTIGNAERVSGLLHQFSKRQKDQQCAADLLTKAPVRFDPDLQCDWKYLTEKLQVVVNGNAPFDETFKYEHQALQKRAMNLVFQDYQLSCIKLRAIEAGLEVVDSAGLITVNLKGIAKGYSYEIRSLGQKNSQSATHFQLVADPGLNEALDGAVAVAGCEQLKSILPAGHLVEADDFLDSNSQVEVQFESSEVNRNRQRKRRVTTRKKSFYAGS